MKIVNSILKILTNIFLLLVILFIIFLFILFVAKKCDYKSVWQHGTATWICENPKAVLDIEYETNEDGTILKNSSILTLENGNKYSFFECHGTGVDLYLLDDNLEPIYYTNHTQKGSLLSCKKRCLRNFKLDIISFSLIFDDNQQIVEGCSKMNFKREK